MKLLILGSKEFPMGTNRGDDPQPSGGIEVYIDALAPELAKRGPAITIITRRFSGTKKYEKKGDIEVYRVPWIKGFYFRNISFNFLSFIKVLKLDFDIILSNDLFATFFGWTLSKIKNKPLISVIHGTAFAQPQYRRVLRRILAFLEKFTFSRADYVVFLSQNVKENFNKKLGVEFKNWKILPMGLELKRFRNAQGTKIKNEFSLPNVPVITFVGRLIEVKGIKYLIEAVSQIQDDFRLLILGSGPEEKNLKEMVKEKGLDGKVIFTGFRKDVLDILATTDVYVLPSISEGLSISLLEARASGCACIVTDIGLPVKHLETALVIPPKNVEKLAESIKILLTDSKLRDELGRTAKLAVEGTSWEKISEEYLHILNQLSSLRKNRT